MRSFSTRFVVFATLLALLGAVVIGASTQAQDAAIKRAAFTAEGEARRPDNWRSWVFVGAPLTPNALNGGEAAFPEFHNVYIEPSAYAEYLRTGEFPEGTQIVKELVSVISAEASHPDGSLDASSGRGYFQDEFIGLELLVKDNRRFADQPGGWAFFTFGHQLQPYQKTAALQPAENCSACHEANAAEDYVFTQYYPVLRAAKASAATSQRPRMSQ